MLRSGLERLDRERREAPGCRHPSGRRGGTDAVVGHEHEDQVVKDEVGAQPPRRLGAAGQFGGRPQ
jgi:hypothetical protein